MIPGIRFGPFFLDTEGGRLLLNRKPVALEPKPIQLFEILLRNRSRVLSPKELRVLLSDDPTRDEPPAQDKNAIYISVRKLKKALGKKYGSWIVNVPKRGYTISEEADIEEITEFAVDVLQQRTTFVGRESEIAKIQMFLTRTRLLTLHGPPGIGKTQLAMRVAEKVAKNYRHGVFLVNLESISDEKLVAKTVATKLGIKEPKDQSRPIQDILREFLIDKNLLLLLDNCEHLVESCAELVNGLLPSNSGLQVIATSRKTFDVAGEMVFSVPPLSIPDEKQALSIGDLTRYEAIELFIKLAELRSPAFEVKNQNIEAVVELCRQLEGIPLAIELAAAQVNKYSVKQILSVMKRRLKVFRRREGERARHQTLETAIDWSYEILKGEEKKLLRRLSIFCGGWTQEAANAVSEKKDADEGETLRLLVELVGQSLVQFDEHGNHVRYRMLEMIREYAQERLRGEGEEPRVMAQHTKYFLEFAERAYEEGEKGDWMDRLEKEHNNLRSVLQRTIKEGGDIETGLRMCGALSRFWFIRGHISEARMWTEKALALDDGKPKAARARALRTAGFFFGHIAESHGNSERGKSYFEESINIWQQLGDEREKGRTLTNYSFLLNRQGYFEAANEAAQEAVNIFRRLADHANLARAAHNWALSELDQGNYDQAVPLFEESLEASRLAEDQHLEALCLHNLSEAAMQKGELELAKQSLERTLALTSDEALGHKPLFARSIIIRGELEMMRGNHDSALENYKEALEILKEIYDTQGIVDAIEAIACTQSARGNSRLALVLYGKALKQHEETKLPPGPIRKKKLDACLDIARRNLGDIEAKQAIQEGQAMSLEQVTTLALDSL